MLAKNRQNMPKKTKQANQPKQAKTGWQ